MSPVPMSAARLTGTQLGIICGVLGPAAARMGSRCRAARVRVVPRRATHAARAFWQLDPIAHADAAAGLSPATFYPPWSPARAGVTLPPRAHLPTGQVCHLS